MGRMTVTDCVNRGLALVTDRDAQQRRLTDDAAGRSIGPCAHRLDKRAYADAAGFLVMRERQMQRRLELSLCGTRGSSHGAGEETLHVRRPAGVELAVALAKHERIARPILAVHRNHVRMT